MPLLHIGRVVSTQLRLWAVLKEMAESSEPIRIGNEDSAVRRYRPHRISHGGLGSYVVVDDLVEG